jgi:3-oxoacyl-[acyl-carrier protein] reductase
MKAAHELRLPSDPVAVVTGAGTPSGIGAATVRRLAERGARVVAVVAPGQTPPPEVEAYVEADLGEPGAAGLVLDGARAIGPVAILVANAAHSTHDGYEALDAAGLDAHYAVNLRTTALLATGVAKQIPPDSPGRIVALTSGQSLGPMPRELAYAATKGAIEAFVRTLAAEVGHLGITVNAVNPGPTDTTWMNEPVRELLRPKFPPGRIGEPDDAARLIAFLASDDARWITGQVIASEGGFLRS